jgi:N-acetyl-beta-hexosaminidase
MNVENTLNPSDEKVYEFLDKVFTEVAALFPTSTYTWGPTNVTRVTGKKIPAVRHS